MLKKKVTSLLTCMALLLATAPSKAFAQILAQRMSLDIGQSASEGQAQPGSKLRATFAEVKAQAKAGPSMEAEVKRFSAWPKPQAGYGKKEKIIVYSIVAGMIVLAVVLAIKLGKGGHTFCSNDPTDPECLPG